MFDVVRFHEEWNDSFSYHFVDPGQLSPVERSVYSLTEPTARLAGVDLAGEEISVAVSETTRFSDRGAQVAGVWEPLERRIVVRRDQLDDPIAFCGTLLHELTHAAFGVPDLTFEFEEALTTQLGTVALSALRPGLGTQM
jgi:hypothetical protein